MPLAWSTATHQGVDGGEATHNGGLRLIFPGVPTALGRIVGHLGDDRDVCGSAYTAMPCGPDKAAYRLNRSMLPGRLRGRPCSTRAGTGSADRDTLAASHSAPSAYRHRVHQRGGEDQVRALSRKHRWPTVGALGVAGGVLLTSCGNPSASEPGTASQQARAYSYEELAAGRVAALPSGPQFVRVNLFAQAPGTAFPSKTHQPGFVYMLEGVQRYQPIGGTAVDIHAGEGHFQRTEAHVHMNIGPTENRWYQLALWPSAARSQPLSVPTMVVYETEDIASSELVAPDIETLRLVTIQATGHTSLHSHGGLEAIFVLDGSLRVTVAGQTPVTVGALQGAFEPRATMVQETNIGSGAVRYLAFYVTPVGEPFETEAGS
jgi:uncharacterized cupin superfamily protein